MKDFYIHLYFYFKLDNIHLILIHINFHKIHLYHKVFLQFQLLLDLIFFPAPEYKN